MSGVSVNNSWRVAISVSLLLFVATIFVHLTFWGNPTNALHLYAQSGCFVATVLIVGCLAGFSAVSELATSFIKKG